MKIVDEIHNREVSVVLAILGEEVGIKEIVIKIFKYKFVSGVHPVKLEKKSLHNCRGAEKADLSGRAVS